MPLHRRISNGANGIFQNNTFQIRFCLWSVFAGSQFKLNEKPNALCVVQCLNRVHRVPFRLVLLIARRHRKNTQCRIMRASMPARAKMQLPTSLGLHTLTTNQTCGTSKRRRTLLYSAWRNAPSSRLWRTKSSPYFLRLAFPCSTVKSSWSYKNNASRVVEGSQVRFQKGSCRRPIRATICSRAHCFQSYSSQSCRKR